MFCENCGTKVEKDSQFCSGCGREIEINSITSPDSEKKFSKEIQFYGKDWHQSKFFSISSLPYFDVMIDNSSLYLIKAPTYNNAGWGLLLGFIFLSFIGAAIGIAIGSFIATKKRKSYRLAWLVDSKLISQAYEKDVFLKIPLKNLRSTLILGRGKFELTYNNNNMIALKKRGKEFVSFSKQIEKYVL